MGYLWGNRFRASVQFLTHGVCLQGLRASAMEVGVGGFIALGAECEVLALSFHPLRGQVCVAIASTSGCELVEADTATGDVLARMPLGRRVRHICHQLVGAGGGWGEPAVLILAYDGGDVEVWDSETRVLKDRMLPSKKDEGKAVTAMASSASGTSAIIYYVRGGTSIERAEVGAGKSMR